MKKIFKICIVTLMSTTLLMGGGIINSVTATTESRTQVELSSNNPYAGIMLIQSKDVQEGFGTGFLISPDTLVTNKHVTDAAEDPEANVVRTFDKDGNQIDLEIDRFIPAPKLEHDLALVKLKQPIVDSTILKQIKPFKLASQEEIDQIETGQSMTIVGFPGDKDYGSLWIADGLLDEVDGTFLSIKTLVTGGNSGSPIFNSNGKVIGLINASTEDTDNPLAFGFLLDQELVDFIQVNS